MSDNLRFNFQCSRSKFCNQLGTKVCSRCCCVRYCGSACQEKHWKEEHKAKCSELTRNKVEVFKELAAQIGVIQTITDKIAALESAVAIFRNLNLKDPRPISILDPRLLIIEDILKSAEVSTIQNINEMATDFERVRSNACRLLEQCLYLLGMPCCGPDPQSCIATLERCASISKSCLDILQLLLRFSFITTPTDTKSLRVYQLMPARFLHGKGMLNDAKKLTDEAVECYKAAIVIAKQNEADFCQFETLSESLNRLGIALMGQNKLDEARATFEELYELQCTKTGPGDEYLQAIVMHLAHIHRLQGDMETSEHYLSVAYENVSNLDAGRGKDAYLKPLVKTLGSVLYHTSGSSGGDGSRNDEKRLLEAEKLAKEAVTLTEGDSLLERAVALTHLVSVMLERGRLDDYAVDEALSKYIAVLRELSIQKKMPKFVERKQLANTLRCTANLVNERADYIAHFRSSGVHSDTKKRGQSGVISAATNAEMSDELMHGFRCQLEAVDICVVHSTAAASSAAASSAASTWLNTEDLRLLIVLAHKVMQATSLSSLLELSSPSRASKRVEDWVEHFQVDFQSEVNLPTVANKVDRHQIDGLATTGDIDGEIAVGEGPVDGDGASWSVLVSAVSVSIRHALTYWSVGNALKSNLQLYVDYLTKSFGMDELPTLAASNAKSMSDMMAEMTAHLYSGSPPPTRRAFTVEEYALLHGLQGDITALAKEISHCLQISQELLQPYANDKKVLGLLSSLAAESIFQDRDFGLKLSDYYV